MPARHPGPIETSTLAVTIVSYHSGLPWLERTLQFLKLALLRAFARGLLVRAQVTLVDNGCASADSPLSNVLRRHFAGVLAEIECRTLAGQGNIGYGAANNLAFSGGLCAQYLLTLNPDVVLDEDAIAAGLGFFAANPACAMVTPVAVSPDGAPLFLVKRYPRVSILAVRGFAPAFFKRWIRHRLAAYDRAERPHDTPISDARIVSGCFMLMRREAFERAGGFDERFFLYFEDFDLSYRISEFAAVVRVPECRIEHAGGDAAGKGGRHVWMFARSALRFFGKHGWRW
jgi:hypothetical protein